MATLDLIDVRPKGNTFADDRPSPPAELWAAPPLAPFGQEEAFDHSEPAALSRTSGSRTTLIAGTAIVAVLGAAALAYFFLASPVEKAPVETAETAPAAVQSSSAPPVEAAPSETAVQSASTVSEPSGAASAVVPSPDVAAPPAAEASPQTATSQTASAAQGQDDFVFLQRPGVNIRSAPSLTASVLGTAPVGTQFNATGREGDWVQVENTHLKGWISSQFLGPNKPR